MWRIPVIAAFALALGGPSVNVYPLSGTAPMTVRVRVTIEPDAANREACLFYLSEASDESESCWPLNGAHAARTETRVVRLSAGVYEFGVGVERATPPERVYSPRVKVTVIGFTN